MSAFRASRALIVFPVLIWLMVSMSNFGRCEEAIPSTADGFRAGDLVCMVQCTGSDVIGDQRKSNDALFVTTLTVTVILHGDPSIQGRTVRTQQHTYFNGPVIVPMRMRKGSYYVVSLRPDGRNYLPHVIGPCEITSGPVHLPAEASLDEKINIILFESLRAWRNDTRSTLIIRSLLPRVRGDSPYYNLLQELLLLEGSSNSRVREASVRARLELSDPSALPLALKLAAEEGILQSRIPAALERLGEDGVTTLCLIGEEKYLPKGKVQAIESLRRLASPRSLPTMMKVLDDRKPRLQYIAYSAIEKIRYGEMITGSDVFFGYAGSEDMRIRHEDEMKPTAQSEARVEEVKRWWREEGQKHFDYVATKP